ncbi:hypothetical protein [Microbulbifer pacificus]|uniref:hypothetical protein n=1 Tax=Microbulbifer pacificus TaxID=407164 RepID=UPI000CF43157|nr:hypothetical protein [Microbulbifer pacificus]
MSDTDKYADNRKPVGFDMGKYTKRWLWAGMAALLSGCTAPGVQHSAQTVSVRNTEISREEEAAAELLSLESYAEADARLAVLAQSIRRDPDSVPFADFWPAYLQSSKLITAIDDRETFRAEMAELANDPDNDCSAMDWERWSARNFFELEPHLAAQECYEFLGDAALAREHENAVQYILRGVLGSGDGKSIDTAYEIALLDHAEEILHLAGLQVRDAALQPVLGGVGLVYVVNVEDPESGIQREVFFENERAINVLLGATYPFAGVGGNYVEQIVRPLAEGGTPSAQVGLGRLLEDGGELESAAQQFLNASGSGSETGEFRLGVLALTGKVPSLSQADGVDFLMSAAQKGSANAMVGLAFAYRQGLGVEASEELFEQFMAAADQRLEPGRAWMLLSTYFISERWEKASLYQGIQFVRRAAEEGFLPAKLVVLQADLKQSWQSADLEALLPRLQAIAEAGDTGAQVAYARRVLTAPSQQSAPRTALAQKYFDTALAVHSDAAHALEGDLKWAERDYRGAEQAYWQAMSDPAGQLGMAKLHQQQRLPNADPELAVLWYMMCATAADGECLYQMGKLFLNGEGVERNPELARTAFSQAAQQGHRQAILTLEKGNLRQ